MSKPTFLNQLLAQDPRRLVRFPDYPLDAAMAELRQLQQQLAEAAARPQAPVAPAPAVVPAPATTLPDGMASSIAALATHVWRTRGKMVDPDSGEPREESRKAYRHVEASFEAFAQMGVTLNDWIGQPFDPGLPVKVLTFQPTPGVTRDTVVEAVRPTVIWKDQLLQLGEVIVGIPGNTENT